MPRKKVYQVVKEDENELDIKIREHREGIFKRAAIIIILSVIIIFIALLVLQLKTYSGYFTLSSQNWSEETATDFVSFGSNILKYSSDGASYIDSGNNIIWNESYEIQQPIVTVCGDYAAIAEKGGRDLYIYDTTGVKGKIETSFPISQVDVANQGTVAVILKDTDVSYICIYDKSGNELVRGAFYAKSSGVPMDLTLSEDGKKMGVSLLSINSGSASTTINFYNFDTVGQNEIDNNVGSETYENLVIPRVEFLTNNTMVAFGDSKILIYKGTQKPQLSKEIEVEDEVLSIFYGNEKFGYVSVNQSDASADAEGTGETDTSGDSSEEEMSYRFTVFSANGNRQMSKAFNMEYEKVNILENGQIAILSDTDCLIYSARGIKRFEGTFEEGIRGVISTNWFHTYIFVLPDGTRRVFLK